MPACAGSAGWFLVLTGCGVALRLVALLLAGDLDGAKRAAEEISHFGQNHENFFTGLRPGPSKVIENFSQRKSFPQL